MTVRQRVIAVVTVGIALVVFVIGGTILAGDPPAEPRKTCISYDPQTHQCDRSAVMP